MKNLFQVLYEKGISVEIIDLRTIDLPGLDFETIGESLKKQVQQSLLKKLRQIILLEQKLLLNLQKCVLITSIVL